MIGVFDANHRRAILSKAHESVASDFDSMLGDLTSVIRDLESFTVVSYLETAVEWEVIATLSISHMTPVLYVCVCTSTCVCACACVHVCVLSKVGQPNHRVLTVKLLS